MVLRVLLGLQTFELGLSPRLANGSADIETQNDSHCESSCGRYKVARPKARHRCDMEEVLWLCSVGSNSLTLRENLARDIEPHLYHCLPRPSIASAYISLHLHFSPIIELGINIPE
jgi:hypothetical protein